MRTGEIIRYIRLSKNLKLNSVYRDILSRPAIVKFEKGLSDTTTEKLFIILENLNISLEEFYYFLDKHQVEEEDLFFNYYFEAFNSGDEEKLSSLEKKFSEKFYQTNKIKYLHYAALVDLTISYISLEKPNKKSQQIIIDYLLRCENWGYYELILFTNSLDFFSEELILILYKRAKKKLLFFSKLRKFNNEIFTLIINSLVFFIERNNIQRSKYFLKELTLNISKTNNRMYEKSMIIFIKELLNIMETKTIHQDEAKKIISIFYYLDMPEKATQCSALLETVIRNNTLI